jgi:hypothetical protein
MKRLILAGLTLVGAFGAIQLSAPQANAQGGGLGNCAAVLCLACPEGTVAAPTPGNCCRCVGQ